MNIEFDTTQIRTVEFGVGQRLGETIQYTLLPADDTVQDALLRKQSLPWLVSAK